MELKETYGESYSQWDYQDWWDDHGVFSYIFRHIPYFKMAYETIDENTLLWNDAP